MSAWTSNPVGMLLDPCFRLFRNGKDLRVFECVCGRLLTNSERCRRGMTSEDAYPRCLDVEENVMHVLRDCEDVLAFWSIVTEDAWSKFCSSGSSTWPTFNLTASDVGVGSSHLPTVFGVALYLHRNDLVFNKHTTLTMALLGNLHAQSPFILREMQSNKLFYMEHIRVEKQIAWKVPSPGWVKVNIDGSFRKSTASSACGVLVRENRDSWGHMLKAFYCNVDLCSAVWENSGDCFMGLR